MLKVLKTEAKSNHKPFCFTLAPNHIIIRRAFLEKGVKIINNENFQPF